MSRPPCICLGLGCPSCRPAKSPWGIGLCSLCGCSLTAEQELGRLCDGCQTIPRETPEEREVARLRAALSRARDRLTGETHGRTSDTIEIIETALRGAA